MVVPTVKRISSEVTKNKVDCIIDAFGQYSKWYRVAKRISKVSF